MERGMTKGQWIQRVLDLFAKLGVNTPNARDFVKKGVTEFVSSGAYEDEDFNERSAQSYVDGAKQFFTSYVSPEQRKKYGVKEHAERDERKKKISDFCDYVDYFLDIMCHNADQKMTAADIFATYRSFLETGSDEVTPTNDFNEENAYGYAEWVAAKAKSELEGHADLGQDDFRREKDEDVYFEGSRNGFEDPQGFETMVATEETDLQKKSSKEEKEHPWMTHDQATRVAKDHIRMGEVFKVKDK